jgi:hypothetical protein
MKGQFMLIRLFYYQKLFDIQQKYPLPYDSLLAIFSNDNKWIF